MHWREIYYERTVTAAEAVSHIKSGDRVVLSHACAEPLYLVDAMVNNCEAYENVEIVQMVPMGKCRYLEPGMEKHFRLSAIFVGGPTRQAIEEGQADFTPCSFARVPRLFHRFLPVDVALISVTPPDRYGNCSLGVSVDYAMSIIKEAKLVIAQVNDRMPYTYGNSRVPVEKIDYFVEHSAPLPELKPHFISEAEARIGEYCASLVDDGDTLQLGIGAIPDAVLMFLKGKRNLGLHSELLSDGVVELIESGVINNSEKSLYPGKSIIATTSTTRDGKISKIVPILDPGAAVTTIRTNVDYIITEYGIARLTGRTFRDRAISLIRIAHPDFRPQLMEAYEKRFHTPFPVDAVE